MSDQTYEVIAEEVTIHRDVRQLTHPLTGELMGHQRGMGQTYVEGDVLREEEVASLYREALDDSDHELHKSVSQKLKKSSADPSENLEVRLGLPFSDYDEMDAKDVVQVMSLLPSTTIQNIKRYEAEHQNRDEIVNYNIGFGEHPLQRPNTDVEEIEQDKNKAVRDITTSSVEEGEITHGEGVTGAGMPQIAHGAKKAAAGETRAAQRKGRRARTSAKSQVKSTETEKNE